MFMTVPGLDLYFQPGVYRRRQQTVSVVYGLVTVVIFYSLGYVVPLTDACMGDCLAEWSSQPASQPASQVVR